MRSRFTAFVLHQADYLCRTHHPNSRAPDEKEALQSSFRHTHWQALSVLRCTQGGHDDTEGTVEFVATFQEGKRQGQLHEVSRFVREGGEWFYVDGELQTTPRPAVPRSTSKKPGRNDPCWCGSGVKLKKCHGHLPQ